MKKTCFTFALKYEETFSPTQCIQNTCIEFVKLKRVAFIKSKISERFKFVIYL